MSCRSSADTFLSKGDARKHVGQTVHNDKSSRAHTVFRLMVRARALNLRWTPGRGNILPPPGPVDLWLIYQGALPSFVRR